MSDAPKYKFHNKGDFLKSLRALRLSGGDRQKAAEKVSQILGDLMGEGNTMAKLTNHGESRIKHAVKYELPGRCRLVTVQNNKMIWLLYVGDHDDVDKWLNRHAGLKMVAGSDKKVQPVIVSPPGRLEIPADICDTVENKPLLQRIPFPEFEDLVPQAKLRRDLYAVNEDTDDDEIQDIIECIVDPTVQSLLIDVLSHLRKNELENAVLRIDDHFGRAKDLLDNPDQAEELLASGENSELVTDLNSLTPGERKRLLTEDFEPWMLWLHPDQKKAVEADYDQPTVLRGVSGSGKTVILIHRARRLAQKYPGETIGLLTLNRSLARLLRNLVDKLCVDGEAERIKVEAFYDYFQGILRHTGTEHYLTDYIKQLPENDPMQVTLSQALKRNKEIVNEFSPQSGETLEDTWDEFWRIDEEDFRRTKAFVLEKIEDRGAYDVKSYLRDEFVLIRSAFARDQRANSASGESYFEYAREGRSIPLIDRVRRNVLRMLKRYEEYMLAGGLMDELTLSQALLPIRQELVNLPDDLRRRCLLVDEFQDFSTLELSLLKQVPHGRENGFYLAGDTVQKVMVKDFNLGAALLDRNHTRSLRITKNYRNSRQILTAAHSLISHYGNIAAGNDKSIEVLNPEYAVRETAPPLAVQATNPLDVAWQTATQWVQDGDKQPWSVCIVTANPDVLSTEKILASRPSDVHAELVSGDYTRNIDSMVVGTLQEVKGFEFSLIIIVGCDADKLPSSSIPCDERWRDALRLYVAMTRGRDQVVLIYHETPSEFLELMHDHLVWQKNDFLYVGEKSADKPPAPTEIKSKQASSSTPPPKRLHIPKREWDFSNSARIHLLSYFERYIFTDRNSEDIQTQFARWLRPENITNRRVSELFAHTIFRRDIATEIDTELRKQGKGLHWDM